MIEVNQGQIDRIGALLHNVKNGPERVLKDALNRGLSSVRTHSVRQISKTYNITQKDLKAESTIYLRKVTGNDLAGEIAFSGMRIPLYKFNVTPKVPEGNRPVSASVLKSNAPTPFSDAFVARMSNGHIGVFERTGMQGIASRLVDNGESKHTESIRELFGPATAQMASNTVVTSKAEQMAMQVIDRRIEHTIDRILNGH